MPALAMPVPLAPHDDRELTAALRRCADGDETALRHIYERLSAQMLGVAIRLLRRRDIAEEVVHDTFLRIWQKAASFDPERGRPSAWIFAILRYRALNVLRGEARIELVDDFEPMGLTDDGPNAEMMVARLSDESALRGCLDRLEPPKRHAIVLAYTHGLSHGELAGRLGVPLGTIKSWIRRSILALRECMA